MVVTRSSKPQAPKAPQPADLAVGVHLNAPNGPTAIGYDYRTSKNDGATACGRASSPIRLERRQVPYDPSRPQWGAAGSRHGWAQRSCDLPWCTVNYAVQHLPQSLLPENYIHRPQNETDCQLDFTGYLARQRSWGEDRLDGRPDVLFMLRQPETWIDSFTDLQGYLKVIDQGVERIIVDENDPLMRPLEDFPDCPFPVSRNVEGWRMEAWKRIDRRITSVQVCRRMVAKVNQNGELMNKPTDGSLSRRRNAFRDSAFCPAWGQGRSAIWDFTSKELRETGKAVNNSTRHIGHDLDKTENRYLGACQYIHHGNQGRAGDRRLVGVRAEKKRKECEDIIAQFESKRARRNDEFESIEEDPVPNYRSRRRFGELNEQVSSKRTRTMKDEGRTTSKRGKLRASGEASSAKEATGAFMMQVRPSRSSQYGFSESDIMAMYDQIFHPSVEDEDVSGQMQGQGSEFEVTGPSTRLNSRRGFDSWQLSPSPLGSIQLDASSQPLVRASDREPSQTHQAAQIGLGASAAGQRDHQVNTDQDSTEDGFVENQQENWDPFNVSGPLDNPPYGDYFSFGQELVPISSMAPPYET